jgi:hypothetical protein
MHDLDPPGRSLGNPKRTSNKWFDAYVHWLDVNKFLVAKTAQRSNAFHSGKDNELFIKQPPKYLISNCQVFRLTPQNTSKVCQLIRFSSLNH